MPRALLLLVLAGAPAPDPQVLPDAISGDTMATPAALETTPPPPPPTAMPPALEATPLPPLPKATPAEPAPPPLTAELTPTTIVPALPRCAVALAVSADPTPAEQVPWALGGSLDGRRLLTEPFFVAARLGLNRTWSANDAWSFTRTGVLVMGMAGVATTRGVGRVSVALGLGAETVLEDKARQDRARLTGIEQSEVAWRWSSGPCALLELAAGVRFWGPIAVEIAAGPSISIHKVDGERRSFSGLHSRLGLAYDF